VLGASILEASEGGGGGDLMGFLVSARVGIVMDARVSSQLVGSTEALTTTRKCAGMRLLSCMSANMSGLVFQPMESPVAQRTLVGTREVLPLVGVGGLRGHCGRQQADGGSHVAVGLREGRRAGRLSAGTRSGVIAKRLLRRDG
jgi:hypothetical protein